MKWTQLEGREWRKLFVFRQRRQLGRELWLGGSGESYYVMPVAMVRHTFFSATINIDYSKDYNFLQSDPNASLRFLSSIT